MFIKQNIIIRKKWKEIKIFLAYITKKIFYTWLTSITFQKRHETKLAKWFLMQEKQDKLVLSLHKSFTEQYFSTQIQINFAEFEDPWYSFPR